MPAPPIPSATERFATLLRWLTQSVAAMSGGDRLAFPLIGLIVDRIRGVKQRFADLAAQIGAGSYVPRRTAPRGKPSARKPPQPSRLPRKFGWLLPLVPDATGFRSQLEYLLRDPEMAALLAAAPASLGRPLRSLCWMLRLPPPDILAPPKRPRPPRKPVAPPPPAMPVALPPRPQPPEWMR